MRCGPASSTLDREWISSLAKFAAAGVVLAAALWLTARFAGVYFAQMKSFRDETALLLLIAAGAFVYGFSILLLFGWLSRMALRLFARSRDRPLATLKPFALPGEPRQYGVEITVIIGDTMAAPIKFGVGQSVLRKEDDALIRGKGRYTDDHAPQPAMHALMLRSPHAHAKFTINVAKARAMPGVGAVLTADDVKDLGDLPCLFNLEVDPFTGPPYPILPKDEVRHVGDAVAFVVADTIDQARDAIEAIEVNWTPLPAVVGVVNAVKKGAPQVWPNHAGNVLFDVPIGDKKATDAAFAKAHAVAASVDRQSARHHQLHGDARGGRRIRRQARSSDADDRQPGQPSPARNHRRHGAEDAAGKDAGDLSRCRRRVRHQAVSVPRICADRGRGEEAAARPSNGPPIAPTISWATRRAATTSPPRGWRWPRTASFWRWTST